VTSKLADRLKKGLALDNLREAIEEFDQWAHSRPDIANTIGGILKQIERRWTGYALPPDERRRVEDVVLVRSLEILRKVDEQAGYNPVADLRDLVRAYDAIK
jgi:hypothetical protein